jgi:hypothetical protein
MCVAHRWQEVLHDYPTPRSAGSSSTLQLAAWLPLRTVTKLTLGRGQESNTWNMDLAPHSEAEAIALLQEAAANLATCPAWRDHCLPSR